MKMTGQLESIYEKSFGNGGTAAFIKVNGMEFKFGKYPPKGFAEGDFVEFEYTERQNGNYTNRQADYKTFRKSTAGAGGGSAPQQQGMGKPQAPARAAGGYGDDRQETISKQAALNTSLTFLNKMVDVGAIVPPSSVKKAQLLEWFTMAWHTEAAKCYNLSTGKVWDIMQEDAPSEDESEQEVEQDGW